MNSKASQQTWLPTWRTTIYKGKGQIEKDKGTTVHANAENSITKKTKPILSDNESSQNHTGLNHKRSDERQVSQ